MNRLPFLTGFLLCSAFLPGVALAAATDGDFSCATVLKLDAVSPYTKAVIKRAEDGLAYAKEEAQRQNFLSFLPGWALSVTSAWAGLTDIPTQRIDAAEELRSVSACLHLDLTMIDCEIEKIRAVQTQQTAPFVSPVHLAALVRFLNTRRTQLVQGALNPEYPDQTWNTPYVFDRPGTITQSQNTARMCPFSADYAPASDTGFGCDIGIMEPRKAYAPVKAELEGLQAVSDALATYRKTAVGAMKVQQQIDKLFGSKTSPVTVTQITRPHLNAFGCGWTGGWCSDDHSKQCAADNGCVSGTCEFSDKLCDKNRAIRCTDDAQCAGNGPCIPANEAPLRSLRGNFSVDRDQLAILNSFLGTRSEQEISRVFRQDLQTADELPANNQALKDQRAKMDADPFSSLSRATLRLAVQAWSRIQARSESIMYPQDVDATLETAHALGDLHTNISEIARIASKKTGLRDFVTRYAWFLRRSCIYRSCSQLLDQAIKIGTTDECFPYANGEYLNDNPDDPRWQKCKDAAKIEQ